MSALGYTQRGLFASLTISNFVWRREWATALRAVFDEGQKKCCGSLPHCFSVANIKWPYLKYLMRDRSCAVGLCLESRLRSLTVASCRGTGTRGSTLWSWSSSCNNSYINTGKYMYQRV